MSTDASSERGRWAWLTSISYGSVAVWRYDQPSQRFSHGLPVVDDDRAAFPRSVGPVPSGSVPSEGAQ